MENYIALLLLVLPGFIAQNISAKLAGKRASTDKFEMLVTSLIFSTAIIAANYQILRWFYNFKVASVAGLKSTLNDAPTLVTYVCLTFVTSVITGWLWSFIKPLVIKATNKTRFLQGKTLYHENQTVWEKVFDDGEEHLVLVECDGKEPTFGMIRHLGDDGKKEIFVEFVDQCEIVRQRYPEYFNKIVGVYYDFDAKMKITEYLDDVPQ